MKLLKKYFDFDYLDAILGILISTYAPKVIVFVLALFSIYLSTLEGIILLAFMDFVFIFLPNRNLFTFHFDGIKASFIKALKLIGLFVIMIIINIGGVLLMEYIASHFGIELSQNTNEATLTQLVKEWPVVLIVYGCLLGPAVEEIEYRHVIPRFIKNRKAGIVVSNLLFAYGHIAANTINDFFYMPVYFVMGVFLAWVYEKGKDLTQNVALHGSYNLMGFLLKYFWL